MSNTVTMRAAGNAQQAVYVAKSGNSYTSNTYGLITGVVSTDVDDLLNMGCTVLSFSGLPMVAGRVYASRNGATQAAVLTATGNLYAYPVFIPNAVSLKTLSLSVTTNQTGGKGRAALYYDSNGTPGAIVPGTDTGDLDAATGAAVVTATLSTPVTLQPGWYWVASIFTASGTFPSVIGTTATYANGLNALLGSDTAAHALAASGQAATGIVKGSQTYPATDMTTSFPTFPASPTLTLNATTPVLALGL